jgi:hypothetical protein
MGDKKMLIWAAIIVGAGLVYWKFFHHKHKAIGTAPAARKKGGWRSRLKGVASSAARGALTQSGFGGVANIAGL